MKWVVGVLLVIVAVTLLVAQLFLDRILAAKLPTLLTEVAGREVSVGEIEVDLFALRSRATDLNVGDRDHPALYAEAVEIELDGNALLRGQLRLRSAGAAFLSVNVAAWQNGDGGETVSREVFERWLPEAAQIDTLAVYAAEQLASLTEDNRLQRLANGSSVLSWTQAGFASEVSVSTEFSSVFDLLDNQRGRIHLELGREAAPDSTLIVDIQVEPSQSGIKHTIELESRALAGRWQFSIEKLFAWPATSELNLERFDVERVRTVLGLVLGADASEPHDWLQATLPRLTFPAHQAHLQIAELYFDDEGISDIVAEVDLQPASAGSSPIIRVSDLRASLPRAQVAGSFSIEPDTVWALDIDLKVSPPAVPSPTATPYLNAQWLWQTGAAELSTSGGTPIVLLENAAGDVSITGTYMGREALPMSLSAQFTKERGLLGSDVLELRIGESKLTGSIWTDDGRRSFNARLSSPYLDVSQLRGDRTADSPGQDGLRVMDTAWLSTEMPIDVSFTGAVVEVDGLRFSDVKFAFQHDAQRANLDMSLSTSETGRLNFNALAERQAPRQSLQLDLNAEQVALAQFGLSLPGMITQGHASLKGRGANLAEIVPGLAGQIEVQFSADTLPDLLKVTTTPALHVEDDRIVAVSLDALRVEAGDTLNAQGQLRVELDNHALSGKVQASKINVDHLLNLSGSESSAPEDASNTPTDETIGLDLALQAKELTVRERRFSDIGLSIKSNQSRYDVKGLKFSSEFGQVRADGHLATGGDKTELTLSGELAELDVEAITDARLASVIDKPPAGTFSLKVEGSDWDALTGDGRVKLHLGEPTPNKDTSSEVAVDAAIKFATNTIEADIKSLRWYGSDVQGTIVYNHVTKPNYKLDLTSTVLDLTAIDAVPKPGDDAAPHGGGVLKSVGNVARRTLGFLANTATGGLAKRRGGDTFFDHKPLPLDALATVAMDARIQVGRLRLTRNELHDVSSELNAVNGLFGFLGSGVDVTGGPVKFSLTYDVVSVPAKAEFKITAENVRSDNLAGAAPVTLFVDLTGEGDNEAALAGSLSGQIYVAAGRGKAAVADLSAGFVPSDVFQSVIRRLVPKSDVQPRLSCGVAYGEFVDGKFEPPAVVLLQTSRANVLMYSQVDLARETIKIRFDSRNRTGTGVDVGNVFSNTVRLQGNLRTQKIVPNTNSLLWRYGAALATGGLSLIGEGIYKRVMVDSDPCGTLTSALRERVCDTQTPAARSPLVCP